MQSSDAPNKISIAFARDGDKRPIPNTSQIGVVNGAASYPTGFPPLTFIKKTEGGIPPDGEDFNGVFYDITAIQRWQSAGGLFKFDAELAASIGGYPKGAVILNSDASAGWRNTVENNASNPDTGGAGWVSTDPNDKVGTYSQLSAYSGALNTITVTGPLTTVAPSGIAGVFDYYPNDTTTAPDGATVLASAKGPGRWKRRYTDCIEVDWFGAYGVADSKPAVTAAIAAADIVQINLGFRAGAVYTFGSGITWNSTRVGMNGRGCTLQTNFLSGVFLLPTQSGIDVNERISAASNHPFEFFNLMGPGYGNVNVTAMRIEDLSSDAVNAGNIIRNVAFKRFAINLILDRGSFRNLFELCNFQGTQGAGTDTTYGIRIQNAINSGECNRFVGCFIGGRNISFLQLNGNADTYFDGCSFVFCGQAFVVNMAGSVTINNCHIEASSDVARWFQVSGPNSVITVTGSGKLLMGGDKVNFAPFYSDSSCTNGGIVLRDLGVGSGGRAIAPRLIDGSGRAIGFNIQYESGDRHPVLSEYANALSYPSFESANWTADWAPSGTIPPDRTNTVTAHTGTWSLMFAPLPGNAQPSAAKAVIPCHAGQFAALEYWYLTQGVAGSGGTFQGTFAFVDRAGVVIGTIQQTIAVTTDVGTWTRVNSFMPLPAPQGTYGVVASFNLFGTGSGTPKGYIDDVLMTVS